MRRIIDSHCHIYPDAIAEKAAKSIDVFYDGLPGEHRDGKLSTLINTGFDAGISHFIVHSVATTPRHVSSINHFISASVKESGGRMTGLGAMHPESPDISADIDEIISLGLKGVKLHPDIQRFAADDPRAMEIYAQCEGRLPVLIHAGDHRFDYSNPDRIANIAKTFPGLQLIAAHFGGWSVWDEAAEKLPQYPNIFVDTCSSQRWLQPARVKELIRIYGADRVLFATDYPVCEQRWEIDYLFSLNLSEDEYERIFWRNTAKLFDIRFEG